MKDLKKEILKQIKVLEEDIEASKNYGMSTKQDEDLLDLFHRILKDLNE